MDVLIRSLAIFLFLWLVVRVGGKREVAQLSAFDMILLVTVGDLVSQGILQEDYSVTAAVMVVSSFSGGLYALFCLVYGTQRPNPWPRWFGFHEVFHTFTILAFASHYVGVSVATYALR